MSSRARPAACNGAWIPATAICAVLNCFGGATAHADAWLEAGDAGLRHDVQFLVDTGVFDVPLTAWPIPAADLARVIARLDRRDELSAAQQAALQHVERRLERWRSDATRFDAHASGAPRPLQVRSFDDTPREEGEIGASLTTSSTRWSARLSVDVVADPDDDQDIRLDGTHGTLRLGNWLVTAGALDRWWGPGWDGSLILSNNARPVPALSLDRESSQPFESQWLKWIGPWRLSAFMGQMELERQDRDHPLLFGMRVAFRPLSGLRFGDLRPLRGLEFALERTAQWCAEGLPCGTEAFWNVFTGDDSGGDTVSTAEEPGNQLAGWTLRWTSPFEEVPLALYLQKTGESIHSSEASLGQPLNLWGAETWGGNDSGLTWRVVWEYAATSCGEPTRTPVFDCAYNNHLFPIEGYRYRGRPLGHSIDGDGRLHSLQARVTTAAGREFSLLARRGEINRGGVVPDPLHTLSDRPVDLWNIETAVSVPTAQGSLRISLGVDRTDDVATRRREEAVRGFVEWRMEW